MYLLFCTSVAVACFLCVCPPCLRRIVCCLYASSRARPLLFLAATLVPDGAAAGAGIYADDDDACNAAPAGGGSAAGDGAGAGACAACSCRCFLPHPPSCFDPACHHLDHRVFKFISTSSAQLYFLHVLAHARCRGQLVPHTCVPKSDQHILLVLCRDPMNSSCSSSSHLCVAHDAIELCHQRPQYVCELRVSPQIIYHLLCTCTHLPHVLLDLVTPHEHVCSVLRLLSTQQASSVIDVPPLHL